MTRRWLTGVLFLVGLSGFFVGPAAAAEFEVTVTSLLHGTAASLVPAGTVFLGGPGVPPACTDPQGRPVAGEMLGLWVFATHNEGFKLFTLGGPASRELALLSQTGRPFFLAAALSANPEVGEVQTVPATFPPTTLRGIVLCPGQSLSVMVDARRGHNYLSLAAMIFPTNDGFIAVNGVRLPDGNDVLEVYSPAYDSGSEENDENCDHIPNLVFAGFPFPLKPGGVPCTEDSDSDPANLSSPDNNPLRAEGYVHIHPGIRGGFGDLAPVVWNWENPVAKITIQRVGGER